MLGCNIQKIKEVRMEYKTINFVISQEEKHPNLYGS